VNPVENYHIVKQGDEWKFKKAGAHKAIASADTKADAIESMQSYMKHHDGSVKIHKADGVIQEERTYPRAIDPRKSKG
jgi:hypothetical protein